MSNYALRKFCQVEYFKSIYTRNIPLYTDIPNFCDFPLTIFQNTVIFGFQKYNMYHISSSKRWCLLEEIKALRCDTTVLTKWLNKRKG